MSKKVIIVGAGIAGLASAVRLKHKGYDVSVFESNAYTGGKLHAFEQDGFRFDKGPSLFTMPGFIDELFALNEENPRDHFDYKRKETVCNYFWENGLRFQVPADEQTFVREAANTFNESEKNITEYLQNSRLKYERTAPLFLEKSLHKLNTYLSKSTLQAIASIASLNLTDSLNDTNESYFNNPHLVQLFNRYATYNGSSPYKTPGIMSLIPHLEMHHGTYYPEGGMHRISQSVYALAERMGVVFHLGTPVQEILYQGKQVTGVQTEHGTHQADIVVTNMDVFSTFHRLLPGAKKPEKTLRQERSSSALIFYWGMNTHYPELDLHNIFFTEDYKKEFAALFESRELYEDPTVYVNITSKEDSDDAPTGGENWFVMVNAPGNIGQNWTEIQQLAKQRIIHKLEKVLGKPVADHITTEYIWDPRGIETDTSSHEGSLYGTSSNSRFAAFLRHPNFSRQFSNLYFCGGSVHPGGGIPLCLLSAKIVADLVPEAQ